MGVYINILFSYLYCFLKKFKASDEEVLKMKMMFDFDRYGDLI